MARIDGLLPCIPMGDLEERGWFMGAGDMINKRIQGLVGAHVRIPRSLSGTNLLVNLFWYLERAFLEEVVPKGLCWP